MRNVPCMHARSRYYRYTWLHVMLRHENIFFCYCSVDATEPHLIRIQPIRFESGSDLDSFCHSVDRLKAIKLRTIYNYRHPFTKHRSCVSDTKMPRLHSQRASQTPFAPAAPALINLCPEGAGVHHLLHAHAHQRLPCTSSPCAPLSFTSGSSGCCSGTAPGGQQRVGAECSSASPSVPHCSWFL